MRTLRNWVLFGICAGIAVASSPTDAERRYEAKHGRPTPSREAKLKAEAANSAYREAPAPAEEKSSWVDRWFRAKHGRPSPREEAREKADQANSAYREAPPAAPKNDWLRDYLKAKHGVERKER